MSEDEKTSGSFRDSFEGEKDDQTLPETLPRVPAAHHMQNLLARGNVEDGPTEPSSNLFHRILDPINPIFFDMGVAGEQVVRSSEELRQSADYSLLQPTLDKNDLSNTNNFLSRSCMWNEIMGNFENNPDENSDQPLELSMEEASYKTDVISDSENNSCKMIQSNIFASSPDCSSSALSSSNNSRNEEKRHVCGVCQKVFSSSSNLSRHKRAHTGKKSHVCNTCPKTFRRADCLKTHMRVHTGEKPYTCDICQKSFPQSSGLAEHAGVHSTYKPHRCDYCDFKSAHKRSLKEHLRRCHSEHKEECPLCYDFYSKESLHFHKRKRK